MVFNTPHFSFTVDAQERAHRWRWWHRTVDALVRGDSRLLLDELLEPPQDILFHESPHSCAELLLWGFEELDEIGAAGWCPKGRQCPKAKRCRLCLDGSHGPCWSYWSPDLGYPVTWELRRTPSFHPRWPPQPTGGILSIKLHRASVAEFQFLENRLAWEARWFNVPENPDALSVRKRFLVTGTIADYSTLSLGELKVWAPLATQPPN
jgi:hypothetical protein